MGAIVKQDRKLAIIADDFTGAGDAGVHFSSLGKEIRLLLDFSSLHVSSLPDDSLFDGNISINCETRFLAPDKAASVVADVIATCRRRGYDRFYKKIDSTMRGNPGAEIEAALGATGKAAALICTAMPETGRTVRDGRIYLSDIPLHETDIGKDPFHPLASSDIADMLAQQTHLKAARLSLSDIAAGDEALMQTIKAHIAAGCRMLIADATSDGHLFALARAALEADCLPVGAGGFARAMANSLSLGGGFEPETESPQLDGPLLAIVGSLARSSQRQADVAATEGGYRTFYLAPNASLDDIAVLCATVCETEKTTPDTVLLRIDNTGVAPRISKEEGARIAALVGEAALALCRAYPFKTVFSTGGETAIAVANALGIPAIDLTDELLPGVVLGACTSDRVDVTWFISKAGGFGNDQVLLDIKTHLTSHSQQRPT